MSDNRTISFARTYRPKDLSEYVGNENLKANVTAAMKSAIKAQVLMFSGKTGNGKTSIARLVSKEYLCENWEEEQKSCNHCAMCNMFNDFIETGDTSEISMYLTEVDCAKQNGVADAAKITDAVMSMGFHQGWRVWIFDECHRLSPEAQSTLLKVIEEPPENTLFIFCTTDPDDILDTIRGRMQLNLEVKLPMKDLVEALKKVCDKEGILYSTQSLKLIITRSDMILRQSLNKLEMVYNTYGSATYNNVIKLFDAFDDDILKRFFDALGDGNLFTYLDILSDAKEGHSLEAFLKELTEFFMRLLYLNSGVDVEDISAPELKLLKEVVSKFSFIELSKINDGLRSVKKDRVELDLIALCLNLIADRQAAEKMELAIAMGQVPVVGGVNELTGQVGDNVNLLDESVVDGMAKEYTQMVKDEKIQVQNDNLTEGVKSLFEPMVFEDIDEGSLDI